MKKENDSEETCTFIILCYFLGEKYQVFMPKIIPLFKQTLSVPLLPFFHADDTISQFSIPNIKETIERIAFIDSIIENNQISLDLTELLQLKNNDSLIEALLCGKPISLIGDEFITKRVLNQMMLFTPHRSLRINEYPDQSIDPKEVDIVLVQPNKKKAFKDFIQVDLEKMKVTNGLSCRFCDSIIQDIRKLNDPYITTLYIKRKINFLLSKATLIRNLSWGTQMDTRDIVSIRSGLEPSAEKIVLQLAKGKTTRLQTMLDVLVKFVPPKKLLFDKNFIQFNENKVIVSSLLSREQTIEYSVRLTNMGYTFLGPRFLEMLQE